MGDIWIWVHHRDNEIEEATYGLATEAKRLTADLDPEGRVTAVALGPVDGTLLERLGNYGIQRVLHVSDQGLTRYQGEFFGKVLFDLVQTGNPAALLMAQTAQSEDLAQRMAAAMGTTLITRAMDFTMTTDGNARAIRPVANGYLFEEMQFGCDPAPIVLFLPSVLFNTRPEREEKARVDQIPFTDPGDELKTRTVKIIEEAPEALDLEEADIIVSGGRGVGRGESFKIVHALATAIGGSVGCTRPIIDQGDLPYERQIGLTGKYVAPRLIINCGISGAYEYTAGMEKSRKVIAIDKNPRVPMLRLADLGVVGDVHEILPLLISRIEDAK